MSDASTFGVELRRARLAAGLSLAQLSAKVHYTKGYLSKLENGTGTPTPEVARRFDAALDAGGRIAGTVGGSAPGPVPAGPVRGRARGVPEPAWPEPDGVLSGYALTGADTAALAALESMFQDSRRLGRAASPRLVLWSLLTQIQLLKALAAGARPSARPRLLDLAARSAEYAGWMAQECGDDAGALRWTADAVRLAEAAGDREMVRYGLVRHAEFNLYQHDVGTALTLLTTVRDRGGTQRVSGLAAQWEAQAYAVAGDRSRWSDTMDHATGLLAAPDDSGSAIGSLSVPNLPALVTGWCLLELGRPEEATAVLDREVPLVPEPSRRAAARFGVRRALAHAAAGDPDAAVALLPDLLVLAAQVDSATVRVDLHRLRHELARWERRPAVALARTDLSDALRPY